jgi:hypothetical protein
VAGFLIATEENAHDVMSLWRKEALNRLPELQRIIASPDVDNPMMLWIELRAKFASLCQQVPQPLDLLRRIWGYAKWSMEHAHQDVGTAAALAFCEHLLDDEATRCILPQIMTRHDYEGLRALLVCRKSEEDFARGLALFGKAKRTEYWT